MRTLHRCCRGTSNTSLDRNLSEKTSVLRTPWFRQFTKHGPWRGFLLAALIFVLGGTDISAQTAGKTAKKKVEKTSKTAKTTKGAKGADGEAEQPQFESLDFGGQLALLDEGATQELDETPAGQERLETLLARTKEIFADRDDVLEQRTPLALPRDQMVGEVVLLNTGIAESQQAILNLQDQLGRLQSQINNGDKSPVTRELIANTQRLIFNANAAIRVSEAQILVRSPRIQALNLQIAPLEQKLVKLWLELNDGRKQWLEIRQPQLKYAHGNYEGLKQVIEDWVALDGLWPDAFCWAALCSYELGQYEAAWDHVEKATQLRAMLNLPKAWAQGEALRGLIAAKLPSRRNKAADFLQLANVYVAKSKNSNWETFFLLGRASYENDKFALKTKNNFEKALKINPEAACVKYWYGRLQATTAIVAVRDVPQGTQALEDLWKHSTKQSWRLADSMVLAYDAADRDTDARLTWDLVKTLAPPDAQEQLLAEREEVLARWKAAADSDSKKSKKSKPASKR